MKYALIAILILSGCASTKLVKYGMDSNQATYKRDQYDCDSKNRTASPAMMLVDMQNSADCMEIEKGWSRVKVQEKK